MSEIATNFPSGTGSTSLGCRITKGETLPWIPFAWNTGRLQFFTIRECRRCLLLQLCYCWVFTYFGGFWLRSRSGIRVFTFCINTGFWFDKPRPPDWFLGCVGKRVESNIQHEGPHLRFGFNQWASYYSSHSFSLPIVNWYLNLRQSGWNRTRLGWCGRGSGCQSFVCVTGRNVLILFATHGCVIG